MDLSPSRSSFRLRPSLLVLIALLVGITVWVREDSSFFSYAKIDQLRYSHAIGASDVKIAVVFAQGENELYYGMRLAFSDPNVLIKGTNKQVRVEVIPISTGNDPAAMGHQVALARAISRDPSYVAVIGHSTSEIASAASVSYEKKDLVYIATTATDPSLTRHDFNYVFRTIPTDEELSNAAAALCHWLRINAGNGASGPTWTPVSRIGIFYEQTRHSDEILKDLEDALTRKGIAVAFEKPYDSGLNPEETRPSLSQREGAARLENEIDSVSEYQPQMIAVIGDHVPPAKALWKALRRSPLNSVPLALMTGPLDANAFIDYTDRRMVNGTSYPEIISFDDQAAPLQSSSDQQLQPGAMYVVTDFTTAEATVPGDFLKAYPGMSGIEAATLDFTRLYQQQFNRSDIPPAYRIPEALAMRGYVAGQILRQAMENSESVAPIDLQQTIRVGAFHALGRTFTFTLGGDEKGFGTETVPVLFKRF